MSCAIVKWLSDKLLAAIQPKGSTPLPSGVIGALFFSMFGHAVAMQLLFAFLPDMIKSFGIADEDAGYYVGMVASAVYLGRFFSSYFWGWLSDKIGRRPVLLICTGLLAFSSVAFGFAKSFEVALIIRLITGLLGGVPSTVKASLTDICDDSNQALGMSVVVTAWNSGLIIGPAVGGYLAKPAAKYSPFKNISFFKNFAYMLPCLANAAISFFSFLLVFFVLPETLVGNRRKNKDEEAPPAPSDSTKAETHNTSSNRQLASLLKNRRSQNDISNSCVSNQLEEEVTKQVSFQKSTEMHLLSGSISFLPEMHLQSYNRSTNNVDNGKEEAYVLSPGKAKPGILRKTLQSLRRSKLVQLWRNKDVRYCICLYTISSFAVIAEHEMYSVWAATGREFGGLGFDTNELGFTLMIVGVGCAVSNCLVFPQMVKTFGVMKTQFITLITMMFFTTILPATNILHGRVLKAVVIVVLLLVRVASACCFTGQFIMLGNSVASNLRAAVHGMSTSLVCGARAISPTVAGSLFSWSITSGLGFPFNEKFVFIFIGFVIWLALVNACCVDGEAVSKRTKL